MRRRMMGVTRNKQVKPELTRDELEKMGQMRLPLPGPLPTEGIEERESHGQKGEKSGKD